MTISSSQQYLQAVEAARHARWAAQHAAVAGNRTLYWLLLDAADWAVGWPRQAMPDLDPIKRPTSPLWGPEN